MLQFGENGHSLAQRKFKIPEQADKHFMLHCSICPKFHEDEAVYHMTVTDKEPVKILYFYEKSPWQNYPCVEVQFSHGLDCMTTFRNKLEKIPTPHLPLTEKELFKTYRKVVPPCVSHRPPATDNSPDSDIPDLET